MTIHPIRFTGRPTGETDRLPQEIACYDLLDQLGISYDRVDHTVAHTIADCAVIEKVLGAPICKNLVLCNRQKTSFYLLLMEGEKPFRTKELSKQIGSARLSFASPEDMEAYLHVPLVLPPFWHLCLTGVIGCSLFWIVLLQSGANWMPSLYQYLYAEPLYGGDSK